MPYTLRPFGAIYKIEWEFFDDGKTIYTLNFMVTADEKIAIENTPWQVGLIENVRKTLSFSNSAIAKESAEGTVKVPFNIPRECSEEEFIDKLFDAAGIDDE